MTSKQGKSRIDAKAARRHGGAMAWRHGKQGGEAARLRGGMAA
jgi:hypothetical protein